MEKFNLTVLGRAHLQRGGLSKFGARLYRQTLNLPYINKDDGQMIPITHEAYAMGRLGSGRDFVIGHITKIKKRDSETFVPLSEAAGAPGTDKGGTVAGSILYSVVTV